jgi:hypothetical protein
MSLITPALPKEGMLCAISAARYTEGGIRQAAVIDESRILRMRSGGMTP